MPEQHHNPRSQNQRYPESGRRDRERDYRRDRGNESYREDRGTDYHYEDRTRNYRERDRSTPYESTREEALYNLKYIPTSRGLAQIGQFFVNLLIVIIAGVPYNNRGRYQDLASMGGLYYYYYGGAQAFSTEDAAKVNQLDDLFYKLKLPPYIFSMACGGALMFYALVMLALGVFRVPYRFPFILLLEAILDGLISLGYIPAVAFYFIKLKEIYNDSICKQRAEMYSSKGIKGHECTMSGTDITGGIFGVMGVFIFMLSAVFAVRAFRFVRQRKQQREAEDDHL